MQEELIFRDVTQQDALLISGIAGKTFKETYHFLMPDEDLDNYITEAFNVENISAQIADSSNQFTLALCKDELVGYLKLNASSGKKYFSKDSSIELERLYVLKDHHGKKIGFALMDYGIGKAVKQGYEILWLAVWKKNINAINFYKRSGFKQFTSEIYMRGNDPQNAVMMKKDFNKQ